MRILTLTLNPAIDQTITLDRLVPGEVHRARTMRQDAGGKGVNVASCLAGWGLPVTAMGLLGVDNAAPFDRLFAAKGIRDLCQRRPGGTRVNLKLVDAAGTTDINMGGDAVDPLDLDRLIASVEAEAGAGSFAILAGSLPPGCPPDLYARLTASLKAKGAQVLLDTSGEPLRRALAADVLPDILKPNAQELAEAKGAIESPLRGAAGLLDRGVGLIAVSMGEEGALFLSREGVLTGRLKASDVQSTVGAGDAMVAGLAVAFAEGAALERVARLSTAFAVGKLGLAGPHLPERATVEALAASVEITRAHAFTGESQ